MKPERKKGGKGGGPKAAWKKKRPVSKSHRDKAQIEQFRDQYEQVSSLNQINFQSLVTALRGRPIYSEAEVLLLYRSTYYALLLYYTASFL